jgi:hypothetical protein
MQGAYDPGLIYAPADLDLYGSALIQKKQFDEAEKVYAKLAADNRFRRTRLLKKPRAASLRRSRLRFSAPRASCRSRARPLMPDAGLRS